MLQSLSLSLYSCAFRRRVSLSIISNQLLWALQLLAFASISMTENSFDTSWAIRRYNSWTATDAVVPENLKKFTDVPLERLNSVLTRFIAGLYKNSSGESYGSETMYSLINSLNCYVMCEKHAGFDTDEINFKQRSGHSSDAAVSQHNEIQLQREVSAVLSGSSSVKKMPNSKIKMDDISLPLLILVTYAVYSCWLYSNSWSKDSRF